MNIEEMFKECLFPIDYVKTIVSKYQSKEISIGKLCEVFEERVKERIKSNPSEFGMVKKETADQLGKEIEILKQALHRDQTGLAASLAQINKTIDSYHWVTEGRGPYAWDDDRYKGEMLTMLTTLGEIANKGLTESGIRSHAYCCEKSKTYEQLAEKVKEQELIIHGLEEGSQQWQSKCADLQYANTQLADKLGEWIDAYDNKEDMSDLYEESALLVINVQEPDHYPTDEEEK